MCVRFALYLLAVSHSMLMLPPRCNYVYTLIANVSHVYYHICRTSYVLVVLTFRTIVGYVDADHSYVLCVC